MKLQRKQKGFSLLEMLLVLAIIGGAMVMLINYSANKLQQMKLERATLQIQQILNSALTYYVNNSKWPSCAALNSSCVLMTQGYLPAPVGSASLQNPYGSAILIGSTGATPNAAQFYVASNVGNAANALSVAGRLPLGIITTLGNWTTGTSSGGTSVAVNTTGTYAVGSVTIPGQNLNNARAINFAGIYRSGACVPAPKCPEGMMSQIYVAPVGVSGINDAPSSCSDSSCVANAYAITSFVAFARGGDTTKTRPINASPYDCALENESTPASCIGTHGDDTMITRDPNTNEYWRVCLNVVTEKGNVKPDNDINVNKMSYREQGKRMGSIMAVTRCVSSTDGATSSETPTGTSFDVYIPNTNWQK